MLRERQVQQLRMRYPVQQGLGVGATDEGILLAVDDQRPGTDVTDVLARIGVITVAQPHGQHGSGKGIEVRFGVQRLVGAHAIGLAGARESLSPEGGRGLRQLVAGRIIRRQLPLGPDGDDVRDRIGRVGRQPQRYDPAIAVADDAIVRQSQMLHDGLHILFQAAVGQRPQAQRGPAVPTAVDADEAMRGGQPRREQVPGLDLVEAARQEQQRRPVRVALFLHIDACAVDVQVLAIPMIEGVHVRAPEGMSDQTMIATPPASFRQQADAERIPKVAPGLEACLEG